MHLPYAKSLCDRAGQELLCLHVQGVLEIQAKHAKQKSETTEVLNFNSARNRGFSIWTTIKSSHGTPCKVVHYIRDNASKHATLDGPALSPKANLINLGQKHCPMSWLPVPFFDCLFIACFVAKDEGFCSFPVSGLTTYVSKLFRHGF